MRLRTFKSNRGVIARAASRRARVVLVMVLINCLCGSALFAGTVDCAYRFQSPPGRSQSANPTQAANDFRMARDLIARGAWEEATVRFTDFLNTYPGDPNYDAALYWLAFGLKKQDKFKAADQVLQRLINERPDSAWVKDAREMRIEIAPQLGKRDLIDEEAGKADDDIKLVALQSLFVADEKQAVERASEILMPGSTASPHLKAGTLMLLAEKGGDKMIGLLVDMVRNEQDPILRMGAMRALRDSEDDRILSLLRDAAINADDIQVGRSAVKSLLARLVARPYIGEAARKARLIEVRQEAIKQLAHNFPGYGIRDFVSIYSTEENPVIKDYLIDSLANMGSHTNQSLEAQAMESLFRIYAAETDEEFKARVITAIGKSNQKVALRKLIEIAKSDPSARLKQRAIEALAGSKDPEAMKFVEDAQKQKQP
jgi:tetratricopeptide (TPR) repeat protein